MWGAMHSRRRGLVGRPVPDLPSREKMSKKDIKAINTRLFNRLCPEVKLKREAEEKAAFLAANRSKAKAYEQVSRK